MFRHNRYDPGIRRLLLVPLMAALLLSGLHIASANDIVIEGLVESVSGAQVSVGGLLLDVSRVDGDDDDISLRAGQRFQGRVQQVNGVWVVVQIISLDGVSVASNTTSNLSSNQSNNMSNKQSSNTSNNTSSNQSSNTSNDDDVILVIEGPIQAVNANIITIYDLNIAVNGVASSTVDLRVGTMVRVEGIWCDDDCNDLMSPTPTAGAPLTPSATPNSLTPTPTPSATPNSLTPTATPNATLTGTPTPSGSVTQITNITNITVIQIVALTIVNVSMDDDDDRGGQSAGSGGGGGSSAPAGGSAPSGGSSGSGDDDDDDDDDGDDD